MARAPKEVRSRAEVVVIGGGAVGVCCAAALALSGRDVLLLERDKLCAGSSYGNAAFLPPSRSLPLGAPGVIGKSLRWLADSQGPFRLRLRTDRDLARWLFAFRRSCSEEASRNAAVILRDLVRESLAIYENLASDGLEFGFEKRGLLELFCTPEGEAAVESEALRLNEIGIEARLLNAAGVKRLVPQVNDSVVGGLFAPEDAHINPPLFVQAMGALAEERGATIETGAEVRRLIRDGSTIKAVETSRGTVAAETVVLANGAWASSLGRALGMRFLIEPAKGYSFRIETDKASIVPLPLLLNEIRTTVTPLGTTLRVTAKLDLVGFDSSMNTRRVAAIPDSIKAYLAFPSEPKVSESWSGFRPLTPDGLPLIGRPRAVSNLVVAVGGGRLGLALAPLTAQLVTEAIEGAPQHRLNRHLDPDRFKAERC